MSESVKHGFLVLEVLKPVADLSLVSFLFVGELLVDVGLYLD